MNTLARFVSRKVCRGSNRGCLTKSGVSTLDWRDNLSGQMRTASKILLTVFFLLGIFWLLIGLLSNGDYLQGIFSDPRSSPTLKAILGLATSHSPAIPLVLIVVACLGLYVLMSGKIPFVKTQGEIAEDEMYHQVVEAHGDGGSGVAINTFFKCGGQKLPDQSIRSLCKRLHAIGLDLFPNDCVPKRDQLKFIKSARKIGRTFNTPREAVVAVEEWNETRRLTAPWETAPNTVIQLGVLANSPARASSAPIDYRFHVVVGVEHTSDNIWGSPQIPVRFHHAQVWIESGTVHGCRAYLTNIRGEHNNWKGNEQLTFSPSEAGDSPSKAIYAGVKYVLDVLVVRSDGEIHICNHNRQ